MKPDQLFSVGLAVITIIAGVMGVATALMFLQIGRTDELVLELADLKSEVEIASVRNEQRFVAIDERFTSIEQKLASMQETLESVLTAQERLSNQIERI